MKLSGPCLVMSVTFHRMGHVTCVREFREFALLLNAPGTVGVLNTRMTLFVHLENTSNAITYRASGLL